MSTSTLNETTVSAVELINPLQWPGCNTRDCLWAGAHVDNTSTSDGWLCFKQETFPGRWQKKLRDTVRHATNWKYSTDRRGSPTHFCVSLRARPRSRVELQGPGRDQDTQQWKHNQYIMIRQPTAQDLRQPWNEKHLDTRLQFNSKLYCRWLRDSVST